MKHKKGLSIKGVSEHKGRGRKRGKKHGVKKNAKK